MFYVYSQEPSLSFKQAREMLPRAGVIGNELSSFSKRLWGLLIQNDSIEELHELLRSNLASPDRVVADICHGLLDVFSISGKVSDFDRRVLQYV